MTTSIYEFWLLKILRNSCSNPNKDGFQLWESSNLSSSLLLLPSVTGHRRCPLTTESVIVVGIVSTKIRWPISLTNTVSTTNTTIGRCLPRKTPLIQYEPLSSFIQVFSCPKPPTIGRFPTSKDVITDGAVSGGLEGYHGLKKGVKRIRAIIKVKQNKEIRCIFKTLG